jgi:16S rRNA (adenine1518-N6/adenine1519-N6)-dimethyltransferase
VLRLTVVPKFEELGIPPGEFIQFLKTAFAMKRKTLVNNLKATYPDDRIRRALKQAGARADVRAEAMGLEQMAKVFRNLVVG